MSNETACVTRRTKGDGTIFQNKKGRWIARYKRKGFPPKEFSGKTRAEAQAKIPGTFRKSCQSFAAS